MIQRHRSSTLATGLVFLAVKRARIVLNFIRIEASRVEAGNREPWLFVPAI